MISIGHRREFSAGQRRCWEVERGLDGIACSHFSVAVSIATACSVVVPTHSVAESAEMSALLAAGMLICAMRVWSSRKILRHGSWHDWRRDVLVSASYAMRDDAARLADHRMRLRRRYAHRRCEGAAGRRTLVWRVRRWRSEITSRCCLAR